MIIINFSHPLSPESIEFVSRRLDAAPAIEVCIPVQIDTAAAIAPQIDAIVDAAIEACGGVAPAVIVPPALGYVAALVALRLASPEGEPRIVCVNRVAGSTPPRYEATEVI